ACPFRLSWRMASRPTRWRVTSLRAVGPAGGRSSVIPSTPLSTETPDAPPTVLSGQPIVGVGTGGVEGRRPCRGVCRHRPTGRPDAVATGPERSGRVPDERDPGGDPKVVRRGRSGPTSSHVRDEVGTLADVTRA